MDHAARLVSSTLPDLIHPNPDPDFLLESTTKQRPTQAKSRNVKARQSKSCLHTPIMITNIDIVCKKFGEKKFEIFSHKFFSTLQPPPIGA